MRSPHVVVSSCMTILSEADDVVSPSLAKVALKFCWSIRGHLDYGITYYYFYIMIHSSGSYKPVSRTDRARRGLVATFRLSAPKRCSGDER